MFIYFKLFFGNTIFHIHVAELVHFFDIKQLCPMCLSQLIGQSQGDSWSLS